jgi:predicted nucleic acid-binding protein
MSAKCFVDTNILAYAYDLDSGPKQEPARALVERLFISGDGVLSSQVLQEFASCMRRKAKRPLSLQETARLVNDLLAWQLVINAGPSVLRALAVEDRYKISFWDALIVQAAENAGADVLYTEDLSDGQRFGTVKVVNPLK